MDVQTLFVVPCWRAPHFSLDTAASLRWGARGTSEIVVASWQKRPPNVHSGWYTCPTPTRHPGFLSNQAVAAAIDRDVAFQYAVLVSDSSLAINPGLDEWVHNQFLSRPKVGLLGTGSRESFEDRLAEIHRFMLDASSENALPWERLPPVVCDDLIALPYWAAKMLHTRGMLLPPKHEAMPCSYGAYMSCAVSMLGKPVTLWSNADQPRPPIYVNSSWALRTNPPPNILSHDFIFYSTLRDVQGYTEDEMRNMYRNHRDQVVGSGRQTFEPKREV